ncbi:MAG: flagellar biosynthetic protein FliR [Nitrospiraceae bacterium]|nr:flagellar biosynthetic protein FliR [Nitrospiraceae bacterium]
MDEFLVIEVEVFKVFVLVLVRISGLVITAPLLGSRNFPLVAKIGITGLTAMLITPSVAALSSTLPSEALPFGLLAVGEVLIGLSIGFVMTLVFGAIQIGGQLMDMQSGFALVNVFNPAFETQFPVFGFLLYILAVLVLLSANGHHVMIRAIVATFDKIPLGGFVARPELALQINRWGSAMFFDGLMIAAPVATALLVAYFVMGLIGRVVPQIQLFAVGFPLTIGIALFVVAMSLNIYLMIIEGMFDRMFRNVSVLIDGMA